MENMSRFKNILLQRKKLLGTFRLFELRDEVLILNVKLSLLILKWKNNTEISKKGLLVMINLVLLVKSGFEYYRSLNEQKVATYDKREEQVKILNRWIGDKKLSSLSSEELQKFLFILKRKGN